MVSLLFCAALCLSGLGNVLPDMGPEKSAQPNGMALDVQSQMPSTALPGRWLTSFDEAKELASSQQVPLIVHFEATWCGPCRQMDATVLNQPGVIQQLSAAFVGVRIDADRQPALISRFSVASLPTEIVLRPDGTEMARFVGIASLDAYVARLQSTAASSASGSSSDRDVSNQTPDSQDSADEKLRACLLVQHDGKTVGLGGFSPVALVTGKVWLKGREEFVASYEGVDYFFQSEDEQTLFRRSPQDFVPRLHGCDPVELFQENRAEAGAIEYGAFYKGQLYFFSSLKNRQRFQSHPDWYAEGVPANPIQNTEKFPFLKSANLE